MSTEEETTYSSETNTFSTEKTKTIEFFDCDGFPSGMTMAGDIFVVQTPSIYRSGSLVEICYKKAIDSEKAESVKTSTGVDIEFSLNDSNLEVVLDTSEKLEIWVGAMGFTEVVAGVACEYMYPTKK